jgi:hypothetical protein
MQCVKRLEQRHVARNFDLPGGECLGRNADFGDFGLFLFIPPHLPQKRVTGPFGRHCGTDVVAGRRDPVPPISSPPFTPKPPRHPHTQMVAAIVGDGSGMLCVRRPDENRERASFRGTAGIHAIIKLSRLQMQALLRGDGAFAQGCVEMSMSDHLPTRYYSVSAQGKRQGA